MHTNTTAQPAEAERFHAHRLAVSASLRPLLAQARARALWLHLAYHDVWVSPNQLERELAAGNLCFSAENWTLRDPVERLMELRQAATDAANAAWAFEAKLRTITHGTGAVADQEC